MEWFSLGTWVGVALTLRLSCNIAPLQPTWMQLETGTRYALPFLVDSLVWPLHLGRDRYDEKG